MGNDQQQNMDPIEDDNQQAAETETPAGGELDELRKANEELQAQVKEYLDKYRRSVADFSNYRKRVDRDRESQTRRQWIETINQFLPIIDDFRLAMNNVPSEYADADWVAGVKLVDRKIDAFFESNRVTPIEAVGQPFDPNYHAAVMQEPSTEYEAGIVTEEVRKGYMLDDQVLRPTLAKVSSGSPS